MEISNEIIRKFNYCYDPSSVGIPDGEVLSVADWVNKYRSVVRSEADIVWLLIRKHFMSDRDMRLFAVWCAREALKHIENPDARSVEACSVAEKFANGEVSEGELSFAESAAWSAVETVSGMMIDYPRWIAYNVVARATNATSKTSKIAAISASNELFSLLNELSLQASTARSAQVNQLLTYFK